MPNDPAGPTATAPDRGLRRRRALFWIILVGWLVLDLASKEWMFAFLAVPEDAGPDGPFGRRVWILDGLFRLSARINPGAAFSLWHDRPWVIYALTAALLPVLVWMAYIHREPGAPLWALGAVVGGALGNLHDRMFETGVRDFFDLVKPWSPGETLWPVFNVADVGIVGGVIVFFFWSMLRRDPPPEPAAASAETPNAPGAEPEA